MKKIIILSTILSASSINAAEVTTFEPSSKDNLEGFYIGAGINYTNLRHKVHPEYLETYNNRLEVSAVGRMTTTPHPTAVMSNISGSIVCGYGKFVSSDFYTGIEGTVDISKNTDRCTKFYSRYDQAFTYSYTSRESMTIPSLTLRIGLHIDKYKTMIFIKGGIAQTRSTSKRDDGDTIYNVNAKTWNPLIGIGVEHSIGKINLRLEGDCRINSRHTNHTIDANTLIVDQHNVQGITVRLLATYKI